MTRLFLRTAPRAMVSVLVTALAISMMVPIALAFAITAAQPSATSDIKQAVELDSPAVVRIVSQIYGRLICRRCNNDGTDITSPANGNYWDLTSAGTGAFISPDGDILTADHVVDHGPNSSQDIAATLGDAASDLASRYNTTTSYIYSWAQTNANVISYDIVVKGQWAFLPVAYTGQLQNSAQVTSYAITRIVANSPPDKQDVAIAKVEAKDLPYLSLASANGVSVGDPVTAIAFPGDADQGLTSADFSALLNPTQSNVNTINSLLTASVQTGQLTAKKTQSDGTPVYETSDIGNHGSSGGPVINAQGQIIGFVDRGPDSTNTRVDYLVPSTVVAEYTQQAGIVNPKPEAFMSLWSQAITSYNAGGQCHWTRAYASLQQLQQQYVNFGGVQSFLQTARTKATPGECPTGADGGALIRTLAILLLLLGGAWVIWQYAHRRQVALVPTAMGGTYGTTYQADEHQALAREAGPRVWMEVGVTSLMTSWRALRSALPKPQAQTSWTTTTAPITERDGARQESITDATVGTSGVLTDAGTRGGEVIADASEGTSGVIAGSQDRMQCHNCGNPVTDTAAKFCSRCGASLPGGGPAADSL
ncbi:MAG: trypsin-like peptidase domain-containing protein [Ktedonobacterales bacterium]|nr:trypsin-like peptidase domain-containing protein [Ktedonobacterales bacterium]